MDVTDMGRFGAAFFDAIHPLTDEELSSRKLLLPSGTRRNYIVGSSNTESIINLTKEQLERTHDSEKTLGQSPGMDLLFAHFSGMTREWLLELRQHHANILATGIPSGNLQSIFFMPPALKPILVRWVISFDEENKCIHTIVCLLNIVD